GGATCTVGGGCIGASASFGTAAGIDACMGASAIRGTGNEAAMGEAVGAGFGTTTRRLVRVADGATAADNAEGDSGVTPLACRLAVSGEGAIGLSTGLSMGISSDLSLSMRSMVLSVSGFSWGDFSSALSIR